MKTVKCLSCDFVNSGATAESACAQCGETLAPALFQQSVDELKKLTDSLKSVQPPVKSFYSFNGTGTMLLDYRALPDGTYEATRWVTIACLPLVPLSSYVIHPNVQERSYGRETSRFSIIGRVPLSAARVLRTYLLAVVGLLPVVVGFMNSSAINRALGGIYAVGLMLLCIAWGGYIIFVKIPNEGKAYKTKDAQQAGGQSTYGS
ncbi:MAG TPA: hypothetical protein VM934_04755 [Pyrinomonadaceae bacterium]|jgi:hypothetical protein|nr:hypothetical protein [Pyrinomonadaceae bacterium]